MGEWTQFAVVILTAISPSMPALSEALNNTADGGLSKRDWLAKSFFKLSSAELTALCEALQADTTPGK